MPLGDSEAVDVQGTKRLLRHAAVADISNFVYVSLVGADEIPFSYYDHKIEAEEAVEVSPIPSTIVRATQFHSFVADMLGMISRFPVWPLPTQFKIQPVDAGEVASEIIGYATTEAAGRVPEIGGPEVRTLHPSVSRCPKAPKANCSPSCSRGDCFGLPSRQGHFSRPNDRNRHMGRMAYERVRYVTTERYWASFQTQQEICRATYYPFQECHGEIDSRFTARGCRGRKRSMSFPGFYSRVHRGVRSLGAGSGGGSRIHADGAIVLAAMVIGHRVGAR